MGNEISMEGGNQGALPAFDFQNEQDAFFVLSPATGQHSPDASPKLRPMDEDEINREVRKLSSASVDVHNTGVSDQLRQLLSTLHEGESPVNVDTSVPTANSVKLGFSAAAQEFVPGKLFTAVPSESFEPDEAIMSGLSLKADAPEFVPSWQSSGMLPVPTTGLGNVRVIDKKVWWYRDPAGVVRGPFSTTEMRAWADKGYFSVGLEIALSDRGPYLPLASVYPSPERAFWKTIEPREFATRMRQHILASRSGMENDP